MSTTSYTVHAGDRDLSDAIAHPLTALHEAKDVARRVSVEQPDALVSVRSVRQQDLPPDAWSYPYAAVYVDGLELRPGGPRWWSATA